MRSGLRRLWVFAVCASFWLFLAASRLPAQTSSGGLRGQVTDPSGAAVPQVTVLAAPAPGRPGETKGAVAGNDGSYEIRNLRPGTYVVSAFAKNFAPFEQQKVTVLAGQAQKLNIRLQIQREVQQVTVSSQAAAVSVSSENNASAIEIKGKDLESLSDDPDELQTELQALAGPAAGPRP